MQLLARQAEVGADKLDVEQGGNGCEYIGTDLFGGGAIGPAIQVRDMGPDTVYAEGVGFIPL